MSEMGRPTVLTKEVVQKLEHAFSIGATDIEACFYAGISRGTLYNYQKENPDFLDRKEMLKERQVFKARMVIVQALQDGDKNMAKWYLERKRKDEFATQQINQVALGGFKFITEAEDDDL
jgi:hypothetical protein